MNVIADLSCVDYSAKRQDVVFEIANMVASASPSVPSGNQVHVRIRNQMELVTSVVEHLRARGVKQHDDRTSKHNNEMFFTLHRAREWSVEECLAAKFVVVSAVNGWGMTYAENESVAPRTICIDELGVEEGEERRAIAAQPNGITVHESIRPVIDALELKCLVWLDIAPVVGWGRECVLAEWPDYLGAYSMMSSSMRLPRMSPSVRYLPRTAAALEKYVDHPDFDDLQPHYLRAEVEVLGPFDVAVAQEGFRLADRRVVVTSRAYGALLDAGVPLIGVPVVIEG